MSGLAYLADVPLAGWVIVAVTIAVLIGLKLTRARRTTRAQRPPTQIMAGARGIVYRDGQSHIVPIEQVIDAHGNYRRTTSKETPR